jgi:glyoxylase-like metal-dependent hydrolase (beta-lactamase superfamily II)
MIKFKLLKVGSCNHPECIAAKGGSLSSVEFPALVGLLKHPKEGYILYDTGYAEHFFEATSIKKFPNNIYKLITPVKLKPEDCLKEQLKREGLEINDVKYIIISHFHADHIAGLKDFPKTKFICFTDEYKSYLSMSNIQKLFHAHLSDLIPDDFNKRMIDAEKCNIANPEINGFDFSYDLFGDKSILAIPLKGHTEKQLGLVFNVNNKKYFLVADTCWGIDFLEKGMKPSSIANIIIHNKKDYDDIFEKLKKIHEKQKDVIIIPSHCNKTWLKLKDIL